jgi:4-amino-4-deoxy-L-arabinose transferase
MVTMSRRRSWLVLLALALCYLVPLGVRPLSVPDEARYAQIAREMLDSGDWVVPRLVGVRYLEKPVGGYWLNALALMLVSDVNFGVRLPSALAALGTAALIAWLMRLGTGDGRRGLLAAIVYLTSYMVFAIGTLAVLDTMLTFWLTAALAAFWQAATARGRVGRAGWWTAFGAACGCAFLTKGFVALAIPVAAVAPFLLWQRRWRELLVYGAWSVVVATLIALPWSLAIHAREPAFWHDFFWNEHVKRFASEDAQHRQPFWYYVPVVVLMSLPWTPVLPGALQAAWQTGVRGGAAFPRFLLLAFTTPVLLFSLANGKILTYVLPCSAPLALLLADRISASVGGAASPWSMQLSVRLHLALMVVGLGCLAPLPLWFGEHRLVQGQAWPLGAVAAGLLLLALLDVAMLRQRLPPVPGFALHLVCGAAVLPFLWSHPAMTASMPQRALRAHAAHLQPDATLACGTVKLLLGMVVELHRRDIVIVGEPGELKPGLDHPDATIRQVDQDQFPAWLENERVLRPVVLMTLYREDPLALFPTPDRYERTGSLSVFFYDRLPG